MSESKSLFNDVPQERLDGLLTQIQETGTALDLLEFLVYAAKTLGIQKFTLESQGVMLYRLTVTT